MDGVAMELATVPCLLGFIWRSPGDQGLSKAGESQLPSGHQGAAGPGWRGLSQEVSRIQQALNLDFAVASDSDTSEGPTRGSRSKELFSQGYD